MGKYTQTYEACLICRKEIQTFWHVVLEMEYACIHQSPDWNAIVPIQIIRKILAHQNLRFNSNTEKKSAEIQRILMRGILLV